MAIGGGVLLLTVVFIIGIALVTTSQPPPNTTPGRPSFLDLITDPAQGIIMAYSKNTVPAVAATVVVIAAIVSIIVGIVVYAVYTRHHQAEAATVKIAEEQVYQESESFFKKPKNIVGLVGSVLGAFVVIGLVVLAVRIFKNKPPPPPDAIETKVDLILSEYDKLNTTNLLSLQHIVSDSFEGDFHEAGYISFPFAKKYYNYANDCDAKLVDQSRVYSWLDHNQALKSIRMLILPWDLDVDVNVKEKPKVMATVVNMNKAPLLGWARSERGKVATLDRILQFVQKLVHAQEAES